MRNPGPAVDLERERRGRGMCRDRQQHQRDGDLRADQDLAAPRR